MGPIGFPENSVKIYHSSIKHFIISPHTLNYCPTFSVLLPWQRSSRCHLKKCCWTNSWHTKKWCERIRFVIKCNIPISRRLSPACLLSPLLLSRPKLTSVPLPDSARSMSDHAKYTLKTCVSQINPTFTLHWVTFNILTAFGDTGK